MRGEAESIILIEYSAPGTNLALANRDTSSLPALHLPALLAQVPPHSQFTRRATALWLHIGSCVRPPIPRIQACIFLT